MSDRLPRDREKALAAIADGTYTGRVATAAHPLCVCGKTVPCPPEPDLGFTAYCDAIAALTTTAERRAFIAQERARLRAEWEAWLVSKAAALRCPMHPDGFGGRRA